MCNPFMCNGAIETIDDNNFVIKIKTDKVEGPTILSGFFNRDFWWNLESGPHDEHERVYYLKCAIASIESDLWNINADVTFEFIDKDGTKGNSRPINVNFNSFNPVYTYVLNYYLQDEMDHENFDTCWVDLVVHVKINSITGVEQKSRQRIDFETEDEQLSDVALVVEGKKLFVNKVVLATYSPVFRAMFFSGFKESTEKEVVINGVRDYEFMHFLQLIYRPYSYIDGDSVESLLILADRFDVEVIKKNCEKYLLSSSDYVPIAKKLILAETYCFPKVHKKCMNSIDTKEKWTKVFEDKIRYAFGPMTLQAILQKVVDLKMNM